MNQTGPAIDRGSTRGSTIGVLADAGIYDCRTALRRLGHPQGCRAEPIWAARYARACVDMVALNMASETREGLEEEWWALEPTAHDIVGWIAKRSDRSRLKRQWDENFLHDI